MIMHINLNMPFNDAFVKCSRCTNQVPAAFLDSNNVCIHCRTRGRPSDWELREQKKLEKQAQTPAKVIVCEYCRKPKRDAGFCRNCGK